ncbi:MAG: ATP-binding cassette domain-containing protein [Proteobacteria bacterium]|nr:ATP-binding cassette domain-containing protein [Pseudomonadota bacterium]
MGRDPGRGRQHHRLDGVERLPGGELPLRPRAARRQRARLRADRVGFVFQSFHLLPALTAWENVMLPLELRGDRDVATPARSILEKVGLGARLDHYPRQLSGGEQQRVALARAFVTRPSLLLADEPTGNLDTHTGQAIIELLFALNAEAGTTLVLVTHDDHLAVRCRHLIRLDSGRLVSQESARDRQAA